jgi:putative aldouronate transport system permease protein
MGLFAIICIYPLILTLSVSLSSEREVALYGYSIFPQGFTLNTYIYIFAHSGMKILKSYGLTIFVTAVGTLGALLITTMISFAISIKSLRYRNVIAFICNFTIIFSAGLIPWYIMCVKYYHLRNSVLALIVPSIFSVWNMFLLRTYFSHIPQSLYEAAKIDGANYFKIYNKIAMPLCKTGILTVGLMYALQYWNDWWNALMFINDKKLFTLQFYLYNILSNVNAISSGLVPSGAAANIALPAETVKMAVTVITIGPIIFLYPFVQKFFINGIMTGAVKE